MTDYYCDLDGLFNNSTGLDPTTNKYNGPGGLRAAITGDGNAAALVAGDTLYLKGTAALDRYVRLVMSTSTAGWVTGDIVRNDTGSGDDWTGVLVENDTVNFVLHVELATDKDLTDVNVTDGVDNVTQAAQIGIDPAGATAEGIEIDNNSGGAGGLISVIGTTDLTDPTNNVGQAVLDAGGVATYGINVTAAVTEWHLEGIDCKNATSHGMFANVGASHRWEIICCRFYDNGTDGLFASSLTAVNCLKIACYDNTDDGLSSISEGRVRWSRFVNNADAGVNASVSGVYISCIITGNGDHGLSFSSASMVTGSVIDNNAGDGVRSFSNVPGNIIETNRLTNNSGYGVNAIDNASNPYEDYNVFHNNDSGDLNNTAGGIHSYGDDAAHIADPADDGYTSRTILITYDGGVNMNSASIGDVVTDGSWTGVVRTVPTGAVTGSFECDTLAGGNPANNDAITLGGVETAVVDGHPSVMFTGANATDYNVLLGKEIYSTPIDLFWDA